MEHLREPLSGWIRHRVTGRKSDWFEEAGSRSTKKGQLLFKQMVLKKLCL